MQRKEYGEDDVRKDVRNGTIWAVVIGLVLAYPLGYMTLPAEFTFIQKFFPGAVLSVMLGGAIVAFADGILRERRYRRESRRRQSAGSSQ